MYRSKKAISRVGLQQLLSNMNVILRQKKIVVHLREEIRSKDRILFLISCFQSEKNSPPLASGGRSP